MLKDGSLHGTILSQIPNHSATLTCDVIDHHSHCRVTYVARNEAPKTLLPSGVPQLEPYLHRQTDRDECCGQCGKRNRINTSVK